MKHPNFSSNTKEGAAAMKIVESLDGKIIAGYRNKPKDYQSNMTPKKKKRK